MSLKQTLAKHYRLPYLLIFFFAFTIFGNEYNMQVKYNVYYLKCAVYFKSLPHLDILFLNGNVLE